MSIQHVAFIMDGNGRWATEKGLSRSEGHMSGYQVIEPLVRAAVKEGISELTFFALSCENYLFRPAEEVRFLLTLLMRVLTEKASVLAEEGVTLRLIGDIDSLPQDVKHTISQALTQSPLNSKIVINLALNYSGQWQINRMAQQWAQQGTACFKSYMDQACTPIDILVRTGKEARLSNSFLWQLAYAELFFPDIFWPDFKVEDFIDILIQYRKRQRRFGRTPCQTDNSDS